MFPQKRLSLAGVCFLAVVLASDCGNGGGCDCEDGGPAPGSLVWATRAGGIGRFDEGSGVAVLSDGSVLVTGSFGGPSGEGAVFGPGEPNETSLTSAGLWDIFLARYDRDGTLDWVARAGGTGLDKVESVAVLADGSAFVTGGFGPPSGATATFGQGEAKETSLASAGLWDIFLARYRPDGTLDWATRAGGTGSDYGLDVAVLPDGSAFVTGRFEDTATFGTGNANETSLISDGSRDIFLARYNPDGTLDWATRAGGALHDWGTDVAVLSDRSAFMTGLFEGTVTFGQGETNETSLVSDGGGDVFLARYDPDGTLAWATRAGGTDADCGNRIAVLAGGSALVTGSFGGPSGQGATFGRGEPNETTLACDGQGDIFVARYNRDGALDWAKRAGGPGLDVGGAVTVPSDGSLLVTGSYDSIATFGPGEPNETALTSDGRGDFFLAKYKPDGTLTWARRAGGTDNDIGYDIAVLSDGSAVVTGSFAETATFGEGEANETILTSAGDSDIFVARYNP